MLKRCYYQQYSRREMAIATPSPRTIAHLVPQNEDAARVLHDPSNQRVISKSADGSLGLEIGYHVAKVTRYAVMTTLGRNADLVVNDQQVSQVHLEFRTDLRVEGCMFLSARNTDSPDVIIYSLHPGRAGQDPAKGYLVGRYALDPGTPYTIRLQKYWFKLVWSFRDCSKMRQIISKECANSEPFRVDETLGPTSDAISNHELRIATNIAERVDEQVLHRRDIAKRGYITIYKSFDRANNIPIAVKVFNIQKDKSLYGVGRHEISMLKDSRGHIRLTSGSYLRHRRRR